MEAYCVQQAMNLPSEFLLPRRSCVVGARVEEGASTIEVLATKREARPDHCLG